MGAKQLKSSNECGSIFIRLSQDVLKTGQNVEGQVELIVKKSFEAISLDLVLEGLEKTQYIVSNGKSSYPVRAKRPIIKHEVPLITYNGAVLEGGLHKVEFHF